MRTSLSEIRQTASTAGMKARNQPQKARLAAAEAVRQPSRRSRSRLSDVPFHLEASDPKLQAQIEPWMCAATMGRARNRHEDDQPWASEYLIGPALLVKHLKKGLR
jgi:hypothetical protein